MKGISDQFLKILDMERRRAWRGLALATVVALLAFFMAELADEPLVGWNVVAYWALLLVGVGVGWAWARWRAARMQESLRSGWNAWMRMSVSCTRIEEIYHKVRDRDPPSPVRGAVLAGLVFAANLVLFIALWMEAGFAEDLGYAVVVANGLVVGGLVAREVFLLRWTRSFTRAVNELVQERVVGVWGER